MPERAELSEKQLQVLKFIEQEFLKNGKIPTYREIAHRFQFKAIGTVQDYMARFLKLGFLEKNSGRAGGVRFPHQTQTTLIPLLGSVPAGHPIEAVENIQGSVALCGSWKGELFALRVQGESMRDRGIFNGDYVIVRKQSEAQNGEIVVAMIDQEATVKILEKTRERVRLLPANPDYRPIELKSDRDNRIIGRVIAVQRIYA